MNDTLGDAANQRDSYRVVAYSPLAIKVREEVDQMKILQEEGTIETRPLSHVRVGHRHAIASGVHTATVQRGPI